MTDPERPQVTPEGHTPEDPAPSEIGKRGTPGAGMTPALPHAADADDAAAAAEAHHGTASHMDSHTALSDDDHAHGEARLGPIDWQAWSYAALGGLVGLLVAALFYVAIS